MSLVQNIRYGTQATLRTLARRRHKGPARPSWSLGYEIAAESLKMLFASGAADLPSARKKLDGFGALERYRRRAHFAKDAQGLAGEWVIPPQLQNERIVLYLHGGGYAIGSPTSHLGVGVGVALASQSKVFLLDYRRAPEHPCPAAIEDTVRCYQTLLERGAHPAHIVIAGESAGGGLALATLLELKRLGIALPAAAVLMSPWVDLTGRQPRDEAPLDYLPAEAVARWNTWYAGELPLDDPRVSPLLADLAGLPPMLIVAGGQELLLSDSKVLFQRARDAGVEVEFVVEEDEIHAFVVFHDLSPRASAALERVGEFVQQHTDNS